MNSLIDFCCICFNNKEHLLPLSDSDINNITYFVKLTSCVPEMCFNEMNDHWLVCNKCCETIDAGFKFRQRCLKSKTTLTNYISHLHQDGGSGATNIYLNDLNKFISMFMFTKVNDEANFEINLITEIKRENNPFSSKLNDTEHIQFENVDIGMERGDQFFEENVNESFGNPLVNQDEIKNDVSQNIILMASAIKKENENHDLIEHLHERFDNILKTCDSKNDLLTPKAEENNDPLYLEKSSDDSSTNLNDIKIDIVNNDIKSVDTEINIQYKNEDIEEFSTEDNVIPLADDDKTDKVANFFNKSLEGDQNTTSLSKKLEQPKKCDVVKIDKKHECNICKKIFLQSFSLSRHMIIHTGEKPHECDVCQKKFAHLFHLRDHMRIHTGEKPHVCDICQKKFTQSSTLREHMKVHTGEKPYECDICQIKCTQLSSLRKHMKTHTGEKPYECEICQKKFAQLSSMKTHMKIHTGEKPYECSVCHKKFAHLSNMKEHKKIHTGEKPHECDVCQKKFIQLATLMRHKRIHTEKKPYECDVCQKKFAQLSTLRKHENSYWRKNT